MTDVKQARGGSVFYVRAPADWEVPEDWLVRNMHAEAPIPRSQGQPHRTWIAEGDAGKAGVGWATPLSTENLLKTALFEKLFKNISDTLL